MAKSFPKWTEKYILALPSESDSFERKGTHLLDITLSTVKEAAVRQELAKQLSAFANTGGGAIIYGLTNDGEIDKGGVSTRAKGNQPMKEWLEDIIPILTDYEITGVNALEIGPKGKRSRIEKGKALYVVEVPGSDRAPHQSNIDQKYYVRLGGKSRPASHRLIEDIRGRLKHPSLELVSVEVTHFDVPHGDAPCIKGLATVIMRITVKNTGRIKAENVCLLLEPNCQFARVEFRRPDDSFRIRRAPKENSIYIEFLNATYSQMRLSMFVHWKIDVEVTGITTDGRLVWTIPETGESVETMRLKWMIFADSAEPTNGVISLSDYDYQQGLEDHLDIQDVLEDTKHHFRTFGNKQ